MTTTELRNMRLCCAPSIQAAGRLLQTAWRHNGEIFTGSDTQASPEHLLNVPLPAFSCTLHYLPPSTNTFKLAQTHHQDPPTLGRDSPRRPDVGTYVKKGKSTSEMVQLSASALSAGQISRRAATASCRMLGGPCKDTPASARAAQ